jgi:DNA-binding NarL/FixJ family response regulator
MTRGTLVVSRHVNNYAYYKNRFEQLGFRDVFVTGAEKDGLNMIINDLNPRLVVMGCRFYQCATPYLLALLHHWRPDLNIAVVSLDDYPPDLAMGLVINGVTSYVNWVDGVDQFYKGLDVIKEGKKYVSPVVEERMNKRTDIGMELPKPSQELTGRQIEVLRLLCNGFTSEEIADVLHLSGRTVKFHKAELYNNLKIRNENELIRVALYLEFIKVDELDFHGRTFELSPRPNKKISKRRVA